MVDIVIVKSKKDIKNFISFPDKLYNGCDYYVPYLQSEISGLFSIKKNPNLMTNEIIAFLAYQEGKVVGRIMGIVNRVEQSTDKCVRISYFDFINDSEVSYALLNSIIKWATTLGIKTLIGPLAFSDLDRIGVLTDGYSSLPTMSESYNYPYYSEHILNFGFREVEKYNSYKIKLNTDFRVSELYEEMEELLEKNNYKMIYGNRKFIIKNYGLKIFDLLYKNSPTHFPTVVQDRVYIKHMKKLKSLYDDNDLCVLTNENDEVIACVLLLSNTSLELQATCGSAMMSYKMYDVSINKIKDLGLFIVNKTIKNEDIIKILSNFLMQNLKYKNICYLESNIWLDDKLKKKLEKNFTLINHKCRVIYEYKIIKEKKQEN